MAPSYDVMDPFASFFGHARSVSVVSATARPEPAQLRYSAFRFGYFVCDTLFEQPHEQGAAIMTIDEREPVAVAEDERPRLIEIDRLLERGADHVSISTGQSNDAVTLPEPVLRLLHRLVHSLAKGQAVTLVSMDKLLTTQQAADLLNVSRPYLVKLLEEGEMPHQKVGTHRRVRFEDVMAYKRRRQREQEAALVRLVRLSEELGLYDIPIGPEDLMDELDDPSPGESPDGAG
jgi:excisionase family DNA binding protein